MDRKRIEKARAYNQARTLAPALLARLSVACGRDISAWADTDIEAIAAWQARVGLVDDGMLGPASVAAVMRTENQRVVPNFIHEAALKFPDHRWGFDISKWQPDIDPTKMQGAAFGIVKCTTEVGKLDRCFLSHKETLERSDVKRGNYHLPRMATGVWGGTITQTDAAIFGRSAGDAARAHPAAFLNWLDTEPDSEGHPDKPPRFFGALVKYACGGSRKKAAEWVRVWFDAAEQRSGEGFGGYISPSIASMGGEELRDAIGDRPLWIACYMAQKLPTLRVPKMPDAWGDRWDIWQMRGSDNKKTTAIDEGGKCLGIMGGTKDCDQNVLNPASPLMRLLEAA